MQTYVRNGIRIAEVPDEGPLLSTEQHAVDIIGETFGDDIDLVVIPASRLAPAVFQLRTGLAGAFIQKFTNYQLRLAILGDISSQIRASRALHDFVNESNGRSQVMFVPDRAELEARLSRS